MRLISLKANWQRHRLPLAALIMLPVLANALVVLRIVDPNPELEFSWTATQLGHFFVPGGTPDWVDGTAGSLTQPLGALSARDWLHGIIPWWNPYSGAGVPLAAEMQTLSFFLPFTFLFKLYNGWFWLRLVMQILSGVSMYALLDRLRYRRLTAFTGAALFSLNGTFFMDPHAAGPIPFLPLILLGIESLAHCVQIYASPKWGVVLIAVTLAYSIYGGFPEVAYLDGMLAATWTTWRFFTCGQARWRFVSFVFLAVVLGLCLAAPLILPFMEYTKLSYLGGHATYFATYSIDRKIAAETLLPFIYGPIGASNPALVLRWWDLGGCFGAPALFLGLTAMIQSGRNRSLVYILAGYIIFWQLRCWGSPIADKIVNVIPYIGMTDSTRFVWPSLEAASCVLIAIAIENWLEKGPISRKGALFAAIIFTGIMALAILPDVTVLRTWYENAPHRTWRFAVILTSTSAALTIGAITLLSKIPSRKIVGALVAILIADAFLISFIPQLSAPRFGRLDRAGVSFLKQNEGLTRFYTLQPLAPHYPVNDDLASINEEQLPVPEAWADYIHEHLDPYADPIMFDGTMPHARRADGSFPPDQQAELLSHLAEYEAIGVRYILSPGNSDPFMKIDGPPMAESDGKYTTLGPGAAIVFTAPASISHGSDIAQTDLLIGTFGGNSDGLLAITICSGTQCVRGQTDLSLARDDNFLNIQLERQLKLSGNPLIRFTISHPSGRPVALWLTAVGGPVLRLQPNDPLAHLVFRDPIMNIYELDHYRPFFSASPACKLSAVDWNNVTADCAAPAVLTRLEEWYPGWHVSVNGHPFLPGKIDEIFQSAPLALGHSRISFYFVPDELPLAIGLALGGLLILLAFSLLYQPRA